MKIGIIGTGNIGATLARRFTAVGNTVAIANSRGPESLRDLAAETGATAVSVTEAAHFGDVVVVTIPEKNVPHLAAGLFADLAPGVVVIDTGNYYPQQRDGRIAGIEEAPSESSWVAQTIGRPVIKAFNNIHAEHLMDRGKLPGSPGRIALPIAGDDVGAKVLVTQLIDSIGFDAVDAGDLDESWRQQPGSPVYGQDYDAAGVRKALAEAQAGRRPEWSAPSA